MKIALVGYGKMGKTVEALAQTRGHEVVLRLSSGNKEEFTVKKLSQCDVAIEFTSPQTAFENILKCFEADLPVVCGSTGWYDKLDVVKKICSEKNQAFIYAANFSPGVNIFFEVNRLLSRLMNLHDDYDVTIEETHHLQKTDKPSGTAITLAADILKNLQRKKNWKLNEDGISMSNELLINSRREENVAGTHIVKYKSEKDEISITHNAFTRAGFAKGALLAAEWIVRRKGFYEVKDMPGF